MTLLLNAPPAVSPPQSKNENKSMAQKPVKECKKGETPQELTMRLMLRRGQSRNKDCMCVAICRRAKSPQGRAKIPKCAWCGVWRKDVVLHVTCATHILENKLDELNVACERKGAVQSKAKAVRIHQIAPSHVWQ